MFLVYKTYSLQKEELRNTQDALKKQEKMTEEQSKVFRNNQFRDFIKFQIEWLRLLINNIQIEWLNSSTQSKTHIYWEHALICLKYSCVNINWDTYYWEKASWLKHWWTEKLNKILITIKHIEKYLDTNYKWEDMDRKEFYYNLLSNEISYLLYELLLEKFPDKIKEIYILDTYLKDTI